MILGPERSVVRAQAQEISNESVLRQQIANDLTVDIGEADVSSAKPEGQLAMVEAQLVQNRGMQVVNREGVLRDSVAELVG